MWVIEEEEYSDIEEDLRETLEREDVKVNSGRFKDLYDNSQEVYRMLESAATMWNDYSGEMVLGSSRQKTDFMLDKAGMEDKSAREMGRAISLLYEVDLIEKEERSRGGSKWDISDSNINEIGKYCKVMAEIGDEIMRESFESPYHREKRRASD